MAKSVPAGDDWLLGYRLQDRKRRLQLSFERRAV
jgi:hypothetical protein